MKIAAILRELMAAGLSGEALCAAVERIEAATPVAPIRSVGAIRQARYRERSAAPQGVTDSVTDSVTGDVTSVTNVTSDVTSVTLKVSPVSPKDNIKPPFTPIQTQTHDGQASARKSSKPLFHRLPADWIPGPLPASLAVYENDWPLGFIEAQAERFRDWAANAADTDGKGRKIKWDQAFHNWLREHKNDRTPAIGRMARNDRPDDRQSGNVRTQAVLSLVEQFGTRAAAH